MVSRSGSRASHRRVYSLALAVTFLVGCVAFADAAPASKASPPPKTSQPKPQGNTGQATLDQAKKLLDSEQYEPAAALLRRFIESSPAPDLLDDAYLLTAAAMFGLKDQTETVRYINQLLGEFPASDLADRAKLLLARTHARAGNLDLALPLLAEVRSLSTNPDTKREALRLTGEFQAQKKDVLRTIQAWLDELPLDTGDQARETEGLIREFVQEKLDVPALIRVRDAYPRSFPGDLASIKLIELHSAAGEDHLVERAHLEDGFDAKGREPVRQDVEGDANDGVDHPVEAHAAGELEREEREHERQHDIHHLLLRADAFVGGHRHRGLGLRPRRDAHEHDEEQVGFAQVHGEEVFLDRHGMLEIGPVVEVAGQFLERFRGVGEGDADGVVQRDQDGELEEHGAQAAEGVHSALPVELHDFFLAALGVAVLLVDLLDAGLDALHGAGNVELAEGQGEGDQPDEDGEGDDREAEAIEEDVIQENQQVHHRVHQEEGEDFADHFFTPVSAISATE